MAKITLGKPPASFKKAVTFPMLDGSEGAIVCEFKYRTRKEFGAFVDGIAADAGEEASGEPFSMEKLMSATVDRNAVYLQQVLTGWSLDEKMTLENLEALCNEVPAAAMAIMTAYRAAIVEGRLGN